MQQLGDYSLSTGESYGPTAQHTHMTEYKSMFDTYQGKTYSLRPSRAWYTESWCRSVVEMYGENQCLASIETLAQSPAHRMDTRETPAAKTAEAAAPRENLETCFSNTKNFPYPRRNGFSTDRPVLPIVTQKREVTCDPSGFILNGSVCLK